MRIRPEDVEAWWEENKEEFRKPATRDVYALICETEADCLSAQIDLAGGATWEEVVETYCVTSDVRERRACRGDGLDRRVRRCSDIVYAISEEGQTSRTG